MKTLSWWVVLAACAASYACFDPESRFYSGVLFNDGETIDFALFKKMGTEGVNYFTACDLLAGKGDSVRAIAGKQELSGKPFNGDRPSGGPANFCTIAVADVKGNTLTLTVGYGGGCETHFFALYALKNPADPRRLDLFLSHDPNDDFCKAIVSTTLQFNLATLPAQSYSGSTDTVSLAIFSDTASLQAAAVAMWKPEKLCSVAYRGHYGANAMVHLGFYTPEYQPALAVPRIVVCLDTMKVPEAAEKALAVGAELRWLAQQKVLGLSEKEIDAIQENLSPAGGQYWIFQDSVLPYNSWYLYDTVNGVWQSGVGAVRAVKGGCGANITYALPRDPLGTVPIIVNKHIVTNHSQLRRDGERHVVYTLRGQRISGARICYLNGLPSGVFIVEDKAGIRRGFNAGDR